MTETLKDKIPSIQTLDIVDESANHAGRAGTESHFKVLVVSPDFEGKSRVQRQRDVQTWLKPEFDLGLHALSLRLLTPLEAEKAGVFQSPNCAGGGS